MKVTMAGNPITLVGNQVKVGEMAPDFKALKGDLSEFKLSDYLGKKIILTSFPSIDTGVCAIQATKFNQEISKFDDAVLITISNDLPFALNRYCGANGINNAITISDHKDVDFGMKYGMLIEELRLLSRAVFVIDKEGKLAFIEVCEEIKNEPNYEEALKVLRSI
ncbi:thiol peroxidase [Streptobacillus moniliformis]|uniref:Thiol peroxidase n=1 Tax=Streptobacillus moniliformis (strain ATCC 14647 / DSM 12112 / NCTC 10651 / 9901) TaxID=519441 RepID=D1AXC7_STRM9|nr:thiol peroxidase [Streptobacillus moniliformis]ACZ00953.1 Redoxin domain protein [Streptobacillus moniliformis DSM 12112]AVL42667.1 thiol peroxidase [Streptobacillus moniliformis]SQA13906.1 Probable thiol peroxidase [Streptobacillus moniliformis]